MGQLPSTSYEALNGLGLSSLVISLAESEEPYVEIKRLLNDSLQLNSRRSGSLQFSSGSSTKTTSDSDDPLYVQLPYTSLAFAFHFETVDAPCQIAWSFGKDQIKTLEPSSDVSDTRLSLNLSFDKIKPAQRAFFLYKRAAIRR